MTIKQLGGVFGRNPTFNDVTIEGQLTFDGDIDINSDLKVNGDLEDPGPERGGSSEFTKASVHPDKGFLSDLLGIMGVSQQPPGVRTFRRPWWKSPCHSEPTYSAS